jgi:RNA polymerase sigma-70 factor (ECF subfamily)
MPDPGDDVVRRFAEACQRGDIAALRAALDADATAVCDGGGLVPAALGPIYGAEDVAQLAATLLGRQPDVELTTEAVNGQAGLALRRAGQAIAVVSVTVVDAKLGALWIVLNPAKLHGWHRR